MLTPFFMGTVVGAIADGNVPAGGNGDAFSSWLQPLPLLTGALFVASGAYLAAIFLVADARRAGDADLESYFVRRALAAALVAGAFAVGGLFVLHADTRYVYDRLVDEALPLVVLSALCGLAVLAMLLRGARRGLRPLAIGAVVAVDLGLGGRPVPLPAADLADDHRVGRAGPNPGGGDRRLPRRRSRRPALARPALLALPEGAAAR